MTTITRTIAASIGLAFAVAACGGSSNVAPIVTASTIPAAGGSGNAIFVVKIPNATVAASGSKRPAYLTPQVKGIDFNVYANDGTVPNSRGSVFYALSPQATYCTSSPAALTCTLPVQAYPGNDWFSVTTYDQSNPTTPSNGGLSHIISTGGVAATIAPNASNTISVTTSGVVSKVLIALTNPVPPSGSALTQNVHVVGLDADYNVIVGNYDQPLALTDGDTSGVTSLSTGSVANASAVPTLTYTGGAIPGGSASITATTTSPSDSRNRGPFRSNVLLVPGSLAYYASPGYLTFGSVGGGVQSLTVNGTAAAYTSTSGCVGTVSISGSAPTYSITPLAPGSCNLVLSYSNGNTITIPIAISPN